MIHSRLAAGATRLSAILLSGGAQAQQQFNGRWSVEVVTEKGECDRAYRYPIAVENGRVRYAGEAGFTINGQVAPNGNVQGSIIYGENRANVRGKLEGNFGTGTWSIAGSRSCSGNWNAEKRG